MCGILRISTFEIMSWVDIDNSTSFQIEIPLIYLSVCLSFLTLMAKTLRAVLHRSGKNRHSYQRKHFQTSSLAVMLAVSFTCVCVLSCVQHFMTFCTLSHQAPLSVGHSSQQQWSRLMFRPLGYLPDPGIGPLSLASAALQADSYC